jgi:hypothetical protein
MGIWGKNKVFIGQFSTNAYRVEIIKNLEITINFLLDGKRPDIIDIT